jgi:two-component system OmpR family response regulator
MGESINILVVDDDPLVLRTLQRIVRLRYRDEGSADGAQALRRVEQGGIHAVVTDVNMPGMSGLELLRVLRDRQPRLPVLVITAKHSAEDEEYALACGAAAYLVKPIPAQALLDTLTEALAARPVAHSAESRTACERPVAR